MISADFVLGNMTDDLVDLTCEFCGKEEDKTLRFPKFMYPSYVDRTMKTALDIQEHIIIANAMQSSSNERRYHQDIAKGKCILMEHLIGIAYRRKYISRKQHDRWQKLNADIHWKLFNWMKYKA